MQGVPTRPVAIGFLLAAPTVNPIVIWSTWIAFRDRPEIVVLRVVFSLLIATIIGYIFSVQKDLKPILQPAIVLGTLRPEPKLSSAASLLDGGDFMLGGAGVATQRLTPDLIQLPTRSLSRLYGDKYCLFE